MTKPAEAMGLRERVARRICSKRIGYQCCLGDPGYGGGGYPGPRCGCGYTDKMNEYADAAIAEVFAWLEEPLWQRVACKELELCKYIGSRCNTSRCSVAEVIRAAHARTRGE